MKFIQTATVIGAVALSPICSALALPQIWPVCITPWTCVYVEHRPLPIAVEPTPTAAAESAAPEETD
ncbi:hypothetical protein QBC42DRAFT_282629 [Cladorrhinum samala]|uniref:Uncharacterized protein n=1 Tax=Cladorrhinum samala TaxID=585594 RepID=A0AAV9I467_9PEZI|nr:hypothetical protein QBC42DRAFT_282629 [Cladorrhinum samala]